MSNDSKLVTIYKPKDRAEYLVISGLLDSVGIGLGFLFEHMPAGTMIGMGVGFILQQLYSKSSN